MSLLCIECHFQDQSFLRYGFFIHKFSVPILYIWGGGDFGKLER